MGCYDERIYSEMQAVSRRFEEDPSEEVWLTCEQATRIAERIRAAIANDLRDIADGVTYDAIHDLADGLDPDGANS